LRQRTLRPTKLKSDNLPQRRPPSLESNNQFRLNSTQPIQRSRPPSAEVRKNATMPEPTNGFVLQNKKLIPKTRYTRPSSGEKYSNKTSAIQSMRTTHHTNTPEASNYELISIIV